MKILHFDKVTSTQDIAHLLINNGIYNALVMADEQTKGKGRLNERVWISIKGNFHGSFIIKTERSQNTLAKLNDICLNTIYEFLCTKTQEMVEIKSPNDILINKKKIAGVLVEVNYPYIIIGIGCNIQVAPTVLSTNLSNISSKEFIVFILEKILYNL